VPRAPAGLYGRLFSPGPDAVFAPASCPVEGWVACEAGLPEKIRIVCEGSVLASTGHLLRMTDSGGLPVPESLRSDIFRWSCTADLAVLADGEQRLDVEVSLGGAWALLDSVCLRISGREDRGLPRGGFDALPNGVQAPRGPITVTGTARHSDGPVRVVVLNLDRVSVVRVPVEDGRWRAEVDLREAEGTATLLSADALLPDGRWVRLDASRVILLDRP